MGCSTTRRFTALKPLQSGPTSRFRVSPERTISMLRKCLTIFAAFAALLLISLAPAAAQQRIALVIGNAAYPKGPLRTSLADGGLVAEALTSIGFEIVEGADVNGNDMRRLFGEFLQKV